MSKRAPYPFYKSIRFRFGLLFNLLLLIFLLVIIIMLYANVKTELKKNYLLKISSGATTVLQKTQINPLTIPLPASNEYFSIIYNNTQSNDTLFNNIPSEYLGSFQDSIYKTTNWWGIKQIKSLETGGTIIILYVVSANEYNDSIQKLQVLLWLYVPIAIFISFIAGYILSDILLKPLQTIITKANQTDLNNDIKLLDEPLVRDELYELVDALNRMLHRINKQSQEQNAFFASASHELRTPLAILLTELQTVNKEHLPEDAAALIDNQIEEVQRLKKLVNTFLLMSQLKAESISANKTSFNVAELCLNRMEAMQSFAKENNINFKVSLVSDSDDFNILADKDK